MKSAFTIMFLLLFNHSYSQNEIVNELPTKTDYDTSFVWILATTGKSTVVHYLKVRKIQRCVRAPNHFNCTTIKYLYGKRKKIPASWHIIHVYNLPDIYLNPAIRIGDFNNQKSEL